ncbi:Hercynine oxygenase [Polaribacter huanghezhanensis]|uniref:formylglycine-generating enzyme family protein n=1 Tax=Polaribacter huanghezhanensis TaxID=1354726 RepID=UPI0026477BC6|nr:SUMF1/EgtB/PvdO family nonheme iron enzyme [Polaribacter huanghezhanensis]WKD85856.1 Hercynine oxygenase [Polaribacter huanghezhanensis]
MIKAGHHIRHHILFVLLCFLNSQLYAQKENIASDFVEIQKDTLGKQYHFYISKFVVSVKEYQDYLRFLGLKLPEPPNYGWKNKTLPMVLVSYKDALSYTNWMTDVFQVQFRLPTEIEWMLAEDSNQKQIHISKEIPICTDCASPNKNGIYGMNGNVWEWTSTLKDKEFNILKGGSYADDSNKNLKENTFAISPSLKLIDVGFRLVMDVNEMKKYEFAFKVDEILKKLFPEYTNIRVEPYGLYLNDGEILWKQQHDIVKIDFGKLKLEFCCLEYANSKNNLEHKIVAFPFAKNDVKLIKKLEKLINKRNLDLFK